MRHKLLNENLIKEISTLILEELLNNPGLGYILASVVVCIFQSLLRYDKQKWIMLDLMIVLHCFTDLNMCHVGWFVKLTFAAKIFITEAV